MRLVRNDTSHQSLVRVVRRGQVMPYVEREINQYVANALEGRLLVHGAAVAIGDEVIVLPGPARAGKTTLAAGLVRRGCGYLTDELVIIQPRACKVTPYPKAFSLKESSAELFESFHPKPMGPPHDRVWYLDPERLRPGCVVRRPSRIRWMIFPQYEVGGRTRITSLTVGETSLRAFQNAINLAQLKQTKLSSLIGIACRASGYLLVFGDLEEGCQAVLDLVRDGSGPCTAPRKRRLS